MLIYPRSTLNLALMLGLVLAVASSLHAQAKFDAAARAKAVAPYLDELTIAVVHTDLSRVDAKKVAQQTIDALGVDRSKTRDFDQIVENLAEMANRLRPHVSDVYVVVSLSDVPPDLPFLVLILKPGADARKTAAAFFEKDPGAEPVSRWIWAREGALVVGPEKSILRLRKLKPVEAPHLERAFTVAGDTMVQAVYLPSEKNKAAFMRLSQLEIPGVEAFEEFLTLATDAKFAAAGFDAPPEGRLRLGIQARDAASAKELSTSANAFLAQFKTALTRELPGVEKLVDRFQLTLREDRLFLTLDKAAIDKLLADMRVVIGGQQKLAEQQASQRTLKMLAFGMLNYESATRTLPPFARGLGKDAKPLLSWRVHILPYIEQDALYRQFKLDEPWDSEHNKKLIEKMPEIYRNPNLKLKEKFTTTYAVPVGENSVFPKGMGVQIAEIVDGTANTVMLVELAPERAVVWTKPDEWEYDAKDPFKGLLRENAYFAFVDGSAYKLREDADPQEWLKLLGRKDGLVADSVRVFDDPRRPAVKPKAATAGSNRDALKQFALAMHVHHDYYKKLPPSDPTQHLDKDGKPLLSWRVHILPFIEQKALYDQFKLNEPWDSEHNKKLIEKMPAIYRNPNVKFKEEFTTTYMVPVGERTMFPNGNGVKISNVTDGLSNTIMIAEVAAERAVVWTRPDEWEVDLKEPTKGLAIDVKAPFYAALGDGSVRKLRPEPNAEILSRYLQARDGLIVDPPSVFEE